jgi:hypothetical protein
MPVEFQFVENIGDAPVLYKVMPNGRIYFWSSNYCKWKPSRFDSIEYLQQYKQNNSIFSRFLETYEQYRIVHPVEIY